MTRARCVKILALSPRGRLHRDRVLDRLWPDATVDVALPRLHKAAHFARRALGDPAAVVLKDEVVALFPLPRSSSTRRRSSRRPWPLWLPMPSRPAIVRRP